MVPATFIARRNHNKRKSCTSRFDFRARWSILAHHNLSAEPSQILYESMEISVEPLPNADILRRVEELLHKMQLVMERLGWSGGRLLEVKISNAVKNAVSESGCDEVPFRSRTRNIKHAARMPVIGYIQKTISDTFVAVVFVNLDIQRKILSLYPLPGFTTKERVTSRVLSSVGSTALQSKKYLFGLSYSRKFCRNFCSCREVKSI